MAFRPCPTPGCPEILEPGERCTKCRAEGDRRRRPDGNPYGTAAHRRFREAVLALNPRCVCPGDCGTHQGWCGALATVADHFPLERVELIERGMDPNDPRHGRGVCTPCHDRKTARTRPGGWRAQG